MSTQPAISGPTQRQREDRRQDAVGIPERAEKQYDAEHDDDDDEFDDEDDDEDDDDDDEDDEESAEEEEQIEHQTSSFDEKFLSQLIAMDPLFGNGAKNALSDIPPMPLGVVDGATSGATTDFASSQNQPTPFPNMPAYASAASTPSNEFYDGAINFLTDVLGSSDPSMWSGLNGVDAAKSANEWTSEPNPPSQARFQNLQPLISNLISRLKGHSVEQSNPESTQVLEEDLVTLLQTLMAQRQAQMEKRSSRRDVATDAQHGHAVTGIQQGMPTAFISNGNGAPAASGALQNPAGMSIVDFEFGEDDDDPDFDPRSVNVGFGQSADFAQALSNVTTDGGRQTVIANSAAEQEANEKVWQQMLDSFGATGSGQPQASLESPARRLRSTSKNTSNRTEEMNVDRALLQPKSSENQTRAVSSNLSTSHTDDVSSEAGPSTIDEQSKDGRSGKRKTFTAEEALERRREANRECARRQRARKKRETEQVRRELERIHAMRERGQSPPDDVFEATRALIGKRKRGRPLGSRNRKTIEETERKAAQTAETMLMADLRADNRMMRTEMQRLREENAKLRARVVRFEDFFDEIGQREMMTKYPLGPPLSSGEEDFDDEDDEERSIASSEYNVDGRSNVQNPEDAAEKFLSYHPFHRGASSSHRTSEKTASAQSHRQHGSHSTRNRQQREQGHTSANHQNVDYDANAAVWQRLASEVQKRVQDEDIQNSLRMQSGPVSIAQNKAYGTSGSLKELIQAASREMGSFRDM